MNQKKTKISMTSLFTDKKETQKNNKTWIQIDWLIYIQYLHV